MTQEIIVRFKDGQEDIYTTNIMELLVNDPFVRDIIDPETGEVYYCAD